MHTFYTHIHIYQMLSYNFESLKFMFKNADKNACLRSVRFYI